MDAQPDGNGNAVLVLEKDYSSFEEMMSDLGITIEDIQHFAVVHCVARTIPPFIARHDCTGVDEHGQIDRWGTDQVGTPQKGDKLVMWEDVLQKNVPANQVV